MILCLQVRELRGRKILQMIKNKPEPELDCAGSYRINSGIASTAASSCTIPIVHCITKAMVSMMMATIAITFFMA